MGALLRFKRETGKDFDKVDLADIELILFFFWCCVKSACAVDGVEFNVPAEIFPDMLSAEDFAAFAQQLASEEPQKKSEGAEKK